MSGSVLKIFNIIKHRGSPTEATTLSGHKVEKQEHVYYLKPAAGLLPESWVVVQCSDYHGEHFVYCDPLYNDNEGKGIGHMAFMCTCGSQAVIVGPKEASLENSGTLEQLLVCFIYHHTLREYGVGKHAHQEGRREWS